MCSTRHILSRQSIIPFSRNIGDIKSASRNTGTTVSVRKLFLNVPARRKFIKTASSEQMAITKCPKRFFLSHPEINFTYSNENGMIYNLESTNLDKRICDVFGDEYLSLIHI